MKKYIQYLVGIELLDHQGGYTGAMRAEKYRELCLVTGVNAVSAREFILQFANKPDEWQKVQSDIVQMLQILK